VDIPTGLYEKDGRIVVELRPLMTREERLQNLRRLFIPTDVPEERYPNLIRLDDIERENLGLKDTHKDKKTGKQ
jgi:hypothetical protein